MRNLIIGLTFSLVCTLTIILIVITWREGELFVFKNVWSDFIGRVSTYDWFTKSSFDRLLDRFDYIRSFNAPSLSDGIFEAIKSVFNLLKNFILVIFDLLLMVIAPLFDLGYIISAFASSFVNGWSEPVVPLIL